MSSAPQEAMRPQSRLVRKSLMAMLTSGHVTGRHADGEALVATAAEYGVDKMKDENEEKPVVGEISREKKKM